MERTHNNGELRISNTDDTVTLIGWVAKRRNLGSLVFIDLRDRYGITQVVFGENLTEEIKDVRNEYILQVKGIVKARDSVNDQLPTGEIEVAVYEVKIVNSAITTPLIIADETDALEDTRMKYRYLDLRRPIMQKNLIYRHKIIKSMRSFLDDLDFVEVETPVLTKSTPEGARDYLVPARVHPGQFYALPQSPQLFKQLLMVAGLEKYYQLARCFRDEDLRADRQLDFSQLDIETSFLESEDIYLMCEDMMSRMMKEVFNISIQTPFIHYSFEEAMDTFGSDKPDNRFGLQLQDVGSVFKESEFKVFSDGLKENKVIKAICLNNQAEMSRKKIDVYSELAKKHGASGLVWLKLKNRNLEGSISKYLSPAEKIDLIAQLNVQENDLIFIVCDHWEKACIALGALRLELGKVLELYNPDVFSFLWVDDFPLLEYNDEDQRFYAKHHPFTRPKITNIKELRDNPQIVKAYAYDLVLNGNEIAGGSLRTYDQDLQKAVFEILGFSEKEIIDRFGFFIDAFKYGTPPHGGIAFGFDRLAMVLLKTESIRDVIAFPKNANARCPLTMAPSNVDNNQLEELHVKIT